MKAIRTTTLGHCEVVDGLPIPSVADLPGFVLVKTSFVGIHHCDYLAVDYEGFFLPNITVGVEFSGVVVDAHPACRRVEKGDRVAGCTFPTGPAMPNAGTHAEYTLAKGDTLLRLDALGPAVREEQTPGLGVPLATMLMALYRIMKLPPPPPQPSATAAAADRGPLLVYGGSTNTGRFAIQYAKLSGIPVLSTCSPRNFALVRGLGADDVFDYADAAGCARALRAATPGGRGVRLVLDCIGQPETARLCAEAMAAPDAGGDGGGDGDGPLYVSVSPVPSPRADVTSLLVPGQAPLGEPFVVGGHTVPADAEAFEAVVPFMEQAEGLIREGKLLVPEVEVVDGWEAVIEKMADLRAWKVSAQKFVARVG